MKREERSMAVADNRLMREVNSAAILQAVRGRPRTSVTEISSATGLSRQAVSRSLTALHDSGLVVFLEPDRSAERKGRPAQLVRFCAEAGHVLGAALSPGEAQVTIADLSGRAVAESRLTVAPGGHIDQLGVAIDRALKAAKLAAADIWSVSVGAPGVIDPVTSTVQIAPSVPDLVGDVLLRGLQSRFDCPIQLDNDIKLGTEGEQWEGEHGHDGSMVMVHWGEQVGAGIVLSGRLHRGVSNDAGDIGFLDFVVPPEASPAVQDPELGSFEAWVGLREFLRLAERDPRSGASLADELSAVASAARDGEAAAVRAVDLIASRFSYGLIAIRAMIDPTVVVIGGPMAELGEGLIDRLAAHLERWPLNPPRLSIASLAQNAVVVGAIRHSLSVIDHDGVPKRP